jgi:glucoamylase
MGSRSTATPCLAHRRRNSMPMDAPGHPGIAPTWTSSRKDLIGTAMGPSRLWFTIDYGIVNEIYSPRIDIA